MPEYRARILQRALARARAKTDAEYAAEDAPEWIKARYSGDANAASKILGYIAQKYPEASYCSERWQWFGIGAPDGRDDQSAQPEFAPKGTDEVAPTDDPEGDGTLHGGDNASQEVPDGEAAGGDKPSPQGTQGGGMSDKAFYSPKTGYRVNKALVSRVAQVLQQWLDGSGLEESPRWDAAQLAWRVKTLSGIARARKTELGTPTLMFLADVSGSCVGFAPRALTVGYAIYELQRLSAPCCIVTHSNGAPEEVLTPDKKVVRAYEFEPIRDADRAEYENYPAWFARVLARIGGTHIVAIGDRDALPTYERLARAPGVEGLIWLDHYACNYIEPKRDSGWRVPRAVRVYGCKNEYAMVRGLEIAIRNLSQ